MKEEEQTEAIREEPEASITEEPETGEEQTETIKEAPEASIIEEPETGEEQTETIGKNMKELVEYIAKSITNSPDDVVVTEEESEQGIILKLQVADEDKGRVIGKQGRVAESIRTLLRVKAAKAGTRASLEII